MLLSLWEGQYPWERAAMGFTCRFTLLATVAYLAMPTAYAGTITIDIEPNGTMYFVTTRNNFSREPDLLKDTDGDGKIEITIKNQETVRDYYVMKPLNGRMVRYTVKSLAVVLEELDPILEQLEPFWVPFFEPVDPDVSLFIEYNIDAAEDFSTMFEAGDLLTATGGSILTTSLITIRDASGLSAELDPTPYDPELLPLYTGELQVGSFDGYAPPVVPTPASFCLGLLGLGLVGVATRLGRPKAA